MTDELIATLAQITALRVIPRVSVMPYKRMLKSLPEIARELNVDAVVEGTILQGAALVSVGRRNIRCAQPVYIAEGS